MEIFQLIYYYSKYIKKSNINMKEILQERNRQKCEYFIEEMKTE